MWVSSYEGLGNGQDEATAIVYEPVTDTVVVTGASFDSATTATYTTIKYNVASGLPIWTANYIGALHFGGGNAIAVESVGSIYVTGGSAEGGALFDYATVKYNRNGIQRCSAVYDGGVLNDYGLAIAVGTSGNVYVTGASATATGDQYATIGYSQN